MGAIRRTFKHLDIHTLPLLYKAMVRPILEYGNTAGYPHLIRQANKIEQVQRRATKLIPSLTNLPYEQRLKKLNLPSIAFRQLRGDMIQVYKYLSRKYNTPPLDSLQCAQDAPHLHSTRGHQYKLTKLRSNSAPRKHFFTFRVVNDWNSLTPHIVSAPTLTSFKRRLDKAWQNHPLRLAMRTSTNYRTYQVPPMTTTEANEISTSAFSRTS